ncbi:unnamed protein product [Anisakis simplex]|uniref:Uncharacterized protein n=1 Tax=Anisakis simplex TaxID=6269 RepID=A0A0M3K2V0_ANISI|nr:unnamed protein product [Anisakis simplex]VDK53064.1 unnamed protein product [Anisakis simplex]VDK53069.1 unnamed protein product [Anisakis simplex]
MRLLQRKQKCRRTVATSNEKSTRTCNNHLNMEQQPMPDTRLAAFAENRPNRSTAIALAIQTTGNPKLAQTAAAAQVASDFQ